VCEPTVFVVDDDPAVRDSLTAVMKARGQSAEAYRSAEDFLERWDPRRPGCLVLDMCLDGMSGLDLQRQLRQRGMRLPVIAISGYPDVSAAVAAMTEGAITYLEKPCHDGELYRHVLAAIDQDRGLRRREARRLELARRFAKLTGSEQEVLARLSDGQPNKQIASEMGLGLRTVELRRAKILQKVEARSLAELIRLKLELESLSNHGARPSEAKPRPAKPPQAAERPGASA